MYQSSLYIERSKPTHWNRTYISIISNKNVNGTIIMIALNISSPKDNISSEVSSLDIRALFELPATSDGRSFSRTPDSLISRHCSSSGMLISSIKEFGSAFNLLVRDVSFWVFFAIGRESGWEEMLWHCGFGDVDAGSRITQTRSIPAHTPYIFNCSLVTCTL